MDTWRQAIRCQRNRRNLTDAPDGTWTRAERCDARRAYRRPSPGQNPASVSTGCNLKVAGIIDEGRHHGIGDGQVGLG